jgi:copper chaperone NosL
MKQGNISMTSRILFILCGLALVMVLFTPIWRIELDAPQYPEGLTLQIFANKIAGDVDIINGLNHYIGMKTLHTEDFIEFKLLPGIISFFAALFILAAIIGKRKWLYGAFVLFVLFGIIAMVDFWRWEYNYGHNLDPNAAIIVPGMAYQPPLIGFKQLLNFGAYSIPDTGGWIFIGAGFVLLFLVITEWRRAKRFSRIAPPRSAIVGVILMIGFSSCNAGPEPLQVGKDQCSACKMTISDKRFGAEIVTRKSKVYKFDDAHCLLEFKKSGALHAKDIKGIYFTHFNSPYQLMDADNSWFLRSDQLRSPMNGNIAAFENEAELKKAQQSFVGNVITWKELSQ